MRFFFTIALAVISSWSFGQICPLQPTDVPVSGWSQQFNADWFEDASYLDGLGMTELGTGVSDSHLAIASNSEIQAFIGVKRRAVIAPADNLPFISGNYQAPVGYSAVSASDPTLTDLASWNFLVYMDLGDLTFADIDVRLYIDFDPCFTNEKEDMFELTLAELMSLSNLDPSEISTLATNQNIASNAWAAFNDANVQSVDPAATGFYTLALAVYDACGNEKLWHAVRVAVGDSFVPDENGNGIGDASDGLGCTLPTACNFDCTATVSDGSCEFVTCSGCTLVDACNYNAEASITNQDACLFPVDVYGSEWVDCAGNCLSDEDADGVCDQDEVVGCQDAGACNYNSLATDAGSCIYPESNLDCAGNCLNDGDGDGVCDELEVSGCTEFGACNYDASATEDNGECDYASCAGCTVEQACNYNAQASISALETCIFAEDGFDCEGNCNADDDGDGVCNFQEVPGCTDPAACNYSSIATDDIGSCTYEQPNRDCDGICLNDVNNNGICDEEEVSGCMNAFACNFDPAATFNIGCDTTSCVGCTDSSACNFESSATQPDYASCTYPNTYYNCAGQPVNDANQNGVPDETEVFGCTDVAASNYNPLATTDNGTCQAEVVGCMLPWALNFDELATQQGLPVLDFCTFAATGGMLAPGMAATGCTDITACNYAAGGDPSLPCDYTCLGCTNELACDFNPAALYSTGCSDFTSCYGCTNSAADNYDVTATIDDGACIISGCTNSNACNFDVTANSDDSSCEFTSCAGCTDDSACNYDADATLNNGLCVFVSGLCDACVFGAVQDNDSDNDGVCNEDELPGCVNPGACNYNAAATEPDGSCVFASGCDVCSGETDGSGVVVDGDADNNSVCDVLEVPGCINENACNYNPSATQADGSCDFTSCIGCTDESACNFDADATLNEPISCVYADAGYGCNGVCLADTDADGVCDVNEVPGCDDAEACNYSASATDNDGSCTYPELHYDCAGNCVIDEDNDGVCDPLEVLGCTNATACNYDEAATESNGTCEFVSCAECGDSSACNYVADALVFDLTLCTYPPAGYDDCAGTVCTDIDADGNCDFDEVPTCIGEFDAPVIRLSGVVDLSTDPATWDEATYFDAVLDDNEVTVTFTDYAGMLASGTYSVTRIYEAEDACGNAAQVGQLLLATGQLAGCTDALASNYDANAVNNDGSCNYDPACVGDLNEDGIIGATDLLILLSGFGIPCE